MDQLVGAAEIAARLGLKRSIHVHTLRGRNDDFPKPVAKVGDTLVWNWPDVERWAKKARRDGRLKV